MPIALAAHILSAVIWVGGMFFAYVCLRPSLAGILEPPQPARLWRAALGRFFRWVWAAIVILLTSGLYLALARYGAIAGWPIWLHLMFGLGVAMMLIFMHVYFAPFKRLGRALEAGDKASAAANVAQIRKFVAFNLGLGLLVIIIASTGRYL